MVEAVSEMGTSDLENRRCSPEVTLAGHSDDGYDFAFPTTSDGFAGAAGGGKLPCDRNFHPYVVSQSNSM